MTATGTVEPELRRIIADRDVSTLFQPIVDLRTGQLVAYEALSRGPAGSPLEMPDALFPSAAESALTVQLDRACIEASLRAATGHGLTAPFSLFLNVEAETIRHLGSTPPSWPVVIEVTERNLMTDPGELLRSVAALRAAGMLIAMDDVGSDPASLALMPLLQPDIIKLDMSLLRNRPSQNAARVMDAVSTYAEHFPTVVLAEGVETAKDLVKARALGATLGQGWYFGRPLPQPDAASVRPPFRAPTSRPLAATPFAVAAAERLPTPSNKLLLIEVSKFLEASALDCDETTLVFSTFQQNANFNARMLGRYTMLASRAGLVAAFVQADTEQEAGLGSVRDVRMVTFESDDALAAEWSVIVLNSRYCAMLSARETPDAGDAPDARETGDSFEYILTHDRGLVTRAAIALAGRL
ncbi:EAL domain-containing protein [Subtercola sp. Z020]|uniref:sensor domain-containing phosphodiesterase n=1 Tax=Subtercola sp. Z020 TaxID=2080582 RepID=UPI00130DEE33|nr:EAL domain-containing protein [Subtercola sp. Z020]